MQYSDRKVIDASAVYLDQTGQCVEQSDPYDRRVTYGWDAFVDLTMLTVAAKKVLEGAAGGFDAATDEITIVAHGYQDGVVVQATTTDTLPTGISAGTDYWVGVEDVDTIKIYASKADLIAGTAVNFTDQGGTGDTTFTQQADDVELLIEVSPTSDGPWVSYNNTAAAALTGEYHKHFETSAPWVRVAVAINKGNATSLEAWLTSMG